MEDRLTQQLHLQSRCLERLNVAVSDNTKRLRSLEAARRHSASRTVNALTQLLKERLHALVAVCVHPYDEVAQQQLASD